MYNGSVFLFPHLSMAERKAHRLCRVPHTDFNGKTARHTAFTYSHTLAIGQHKDLRSVLCVLDSGIMTGISSKDLSTDKSTMLSRTLEAEEEEEEVEEEVAVFCVANT